MKKNGIAKRADSDASTRRLSCLFISCSNANPQVAPLGGRLQELAGACWILLPYQFMPPRYEPEDKDALVEQHEKRYSCDASSQHGPAQCDDVPATDNNDKKQCPSHPPQDSKANKKLKHALSTTKDEGLQLVKRRALMQCADQQCPDEAA